MYICVCLSTYKFLSYFYYSTTNCDEQCFHLRVMCDGIVLTEVDYSNDEDGICPRQVNIHIW